MLVFYFFIIYKTSIFFYREIFLSIILNIISKNFSKFLLYYLTFFKIFIYDGCDNFFPVGKKVASFLLIYDSYIVASLHNITETSKRYKLKTSVISFFGMRERTSKIYISNSSLRSIPPE